MFILLIVTKYQRKQTFETWWCEEQGKVCQESLTLEPPTNGPALRPLWLLQHCDCRGGSDSCPLQATKWLAGATSLPPLASVLPPAYELLLASLKEAQLSMFCPFLIYLCKGKILFEFPMTFTDRHTAKPLEVSKKHTEANFNIAWQS